MQQRTRRGDARTAEVAHVDALAEQRMAALAEVDADLMLAACLEHALDQTRGRAGAAEPLEQADMGHRALGVDGRLASRRRNTPHEPRSPSPRSRSRMVSKVRPMTWPCASAT